ncbi:MAG: hypothetical protein ACXW39_02440 [Nitrospira sp.]
MALLLTRRDIEALAAVTASPGVVAQEVPKKVSPPSPFRPTDSSGAIGTGLGWPVGGHQC